MIKKASIVIFASLCLLISGCGKDDDKPVVTKITMNDNGVYAMPVEPSDLQAELYNKLTDALAKGNKEEIAKLVAENFAADFFSLKNKKSSEEVGGLTYVPAHNVDALRVLASNQVYSNYQNIIDENGKSSLPVVSKIEVTNTSSQIISYAYTIPANAELGTEEEIIDETYDGYGISLKISYEDTKVKKDDLKTETVFSIIELDGRIVIVAMI